MAGAVHLSHVQSKGTDSGAFGVPGVLPGFGVWLGVFVLASALYVDHLDLQSL